MTYVFCNDCGKETPDQAINCVHCGVQQNKPCPRCAEIIKLKAQVCRYCGYQFLPSSSTEDMPPSPQAVAGAPAPDISPITDQDRPLESRQPRHSLFVPLAFGFFIAIVALVPRIPGLLSLILAVAEGGQSISSLRAYESDTVLHLFTNWPIWSIAAAIAIKYIRPAYTIIKVFDFLAGSLLGLAVILTVLPSLQAPKSPLLSAIPSTSPCTCPSIDAVSDDLPQYVQQRICITGLAWNINPSGYYGPYFVMRGETMMETITIFVADAIPSTFSENDRVAVVGVYIGNQRLKADSHNDIQACQE